MHKLYDFMEARERLSTITVKTKLIHSDVFSDECGNDVYIKPENLQITGSFKVRGAYNKIAKLTEEEKARGMLQNNMVPKSFYMVRFMMKLTKRRWSSNKNTAMCLFILLMMKM